MKKIYTILAAMFMAVGVMAQDAWDGETVVVSLKNETVTSIADFEGMTIKFPGAKSIELDEEEGWLGIQDRLGSAMYAAWSSSFDSEYQINGDEVTLTKFFFSEEFCASLPEKAATLFLEDYDLFKVDGKKFYVENVSFSYDPNATQGSGDGWDGETVIVTLNKKTVSSLADFEGMTIKFPGAKSIELDEEEGWLGIQDRLGSAMYAEWSSSFDGEYQINGDEVTLTKFFFSEEFCASLPEEAATLFLEDYDLFKVDGKKFYVENVTFNYDPKATEENDGPWDGETAIVSLKNETVSSLADFEGMTIKFPGAKSIVPDENGYLMVANKDGDKAYAMWSVSYQGTYDVNGDEVTLKDFLTGGFFCSPLPEEATTLYLHDMGALQVDGNEFYIEDVTFNYNPKSSENNDPEGGESTWDGVTFEVSLAVDTVTSIDDLVGLTFKFPGAKSVVADPEGAFLIGNKEGSVAYAMWSESYGCSCKVKGDEVTILDYTNLFCSPLPEAADTLYLSDLGAFDVDGKVFYMKGVRFYYAPKKTIEEGGDDIENIGDTVDVTFAVVPSLESVTITPSDTTVYYYSYILSEKELSSRYPKPEDAFNFMLGFIEKEDYAKGTITLEYSKECFYGAGDYYMIVAAVKPDSESSGSKVVSAIEITKIVLKETDDHKLILDTPSEEGDGWDGETVVISLNGKTVTSIKDFEGMTIQFPGAKSVEPDEYGYFAICDESGENFYAMWGINPQVKGECQVDGDVATISKLYTSKLSGMIKSLPKKAATLYLYDLGSFIVDGESVFIENVTFNYDPNAKPSTGEDDGNENENESDSINVTFAIAPSTSSVSITPSDTTVTYYVYIVSEKELNGKTVEDVFTLMTGFAYNEDYKKGACELEYNEECFYGAGDYYVAVAAVKPIEGVDHGCKIISDIQSVKMVLKETEDNKLVLDTPDGLISVPVAETAKSAIIIVNGKIYVRATNGSYSLSGVKN